MLEKVRPQNEQEWGVLRHHLRNGAQVVAGLVRARKKRPSDWREHIAQRRKELLELLAAHTGKKKQDPLVSASVVLLRHVVETTKLENEGETQLFVGLIEHIDSFLQRHFHPEVYRC